jgi:hypothetical protein
MQARDRSRDARAATSRSSPWARIRIGKTCMTPSRNCSMSRARGRGISGGSVGSSRRRRSWEAKSGQKQSFTGGLNQPNYLARLGE